MYRNLLVHIFNVLNDGRGLIYITEAKYHDEKWHYWSILEHSLKFVHKLREVCEKYNYCRLKTYEQFLLAGALHDTGKFVSPWNEKKQRYFHAGHAEKGEEIIKSGEPVWKLIKAFADFNGFTVSRTEVALLVGKHFKLGELRNNAKSSIGYTLSFAESEKCKSACRKIIDNNRDIALEIGLMFMADTLAKQSDDNMYPVDGYEQLPVNKKVFEVYMSLL